MHWSSEGCCRQGPCRAHYRFTLTGALTGFLFSFHPQLKKEPMATIRTTLPILDSAGKPANGKIYF